MIVKIGGMILEPVKKVVEDDPNFIEKLWHGLQHFSDTVIQSEANVFVKPAAASLWQGLGILNHNFLGILPELVTLVAIIFVSIGMFSSFGKWLGRATIVYLGGCVWAAISGSTM